MRNIFVIMICALLLGCQAKEDNQKINYDGVHRALVNGSYYKKFINYLILQRKPDIYLVIPFNYRNAEFFVYLKDDQIKTTKRGLIKDSLFGGDQLHAEAKVDKLLLNIKDLITFMKRESINSVSYSVHPEKNRTGYVLDFHLSSNEILRCYQFAPGRKAVFPSDVIESTWIDSSWVYLRSNRPEK